jgi:hypothetical protein
LAGSDRTTARRTQTILVGAIGGLGFTLLLVSIVVDLFFRRVEHHPPPTDLVACNQDVRTLLDDLAGRPLGGDWDAWSREWQDRWGKVNTRCGFDEDLRLGTAYDRMAEVHQRLETARLKYRELMARFSRDLEHDLGEMRRALDRSLADLQDPERRAGEN